MESRHRISLIFLTFALAVAIQTTLATPVLKELPSITMDTVNDDPFEPETAESVGPVGAIAAFTTIRGIRGMLRGDKEEPSHGIRYYLSPMRIARSMGTGAISMAKTFYNTFQHQYQVSMKHLQETTIPQAATLMGVWTNPPEETQNQWMTGI